MVLDSSTTSTGFKITKQQVWTYWYTTSGTSNERWLKTYQMMDENNNFIELDEKAQIQIKNKIRNICYYLYSLWTKSGKRKVSFEEKSKSWMEFGENILEIKSPAITTKGRPQKTFAECSVSTKRRRIAQLKVQDQTTIEHLKKSSTSTESSTLTLDETVALIVETNLSKSQYTALRRIFLGKNCNILPAYSKVLAAKKNCYPENITAAESSVEVKLQSLLDHTTLRLVKSLEPYDLQHNENTWIFIHKWGMDGSSGHSQYKQKTKSDFSDSDMFVTSCVPLQLIHEGNRDVIWKNPRPSSTRYCRPIRLQFKKETTEISILEADYINNQISNLQPTKLIIGDTEISIRHELQMTMVDGKVCNALSTTSSSQVCYICQATPKEMNNIKMCQGKPVIEENLKFGISSLHAWIRFFEYFLHMSYKLQLKKWQVRDEKEKFLVKTQKERIQKEFREKTGLIIDKPKLGGSGTTNDGNTARRFFANPALSACITGLDEELLKRCAVILQTISSGHEIDAEKFDEYCINTAKQLVTKYDWYYLPASVHKILIHGSQIVLKAILPIGQMSEEAAECRNKDIKSFRLKHTRKTSRETTNLDLINRLLLTSDPFISCIIPLPRKNKVQLSEDVINLLRFN